MQALVAAAILCALPSSALNATIINGVLTVPGQMPRTIGNSSSNVSEAIASTFGSYSGAFGNASRILKNSTSFYNYLELTGTYNADAPILLEPGLVLVLADATIRTEEASLQTPNALIAAVSAAWSAVVGRGVARLICSPGGGEVAPKSVYASQSAGFVLDGLQISDCGSVHLNGSPFVTGGEVANCNMSNSRGQSVWLEKIARAVIHGNTITNASYHTIDADAFTSGALIMNNTVSFSREEAVFLEQGSSNVVVVDNDIGPGNARGIGVYNNAIGAPTSGHVIARNRIFGCTNAGVSVGSTAPKSGAPDENVLVAGNSLWSNAGQGIHSNGGQLGTVYVANADADGVSLYSLNGAGTAANLSFADPFDRVKAAAI